jgi:signal transduction histidine kinase/ActR/RegA family two-component response regulator
LRSKLLLLATVGVVPMLILSSVLGYFLIEHQRETFREATRQRNQTLLSAVDAQMLGYVGTLRALAASSSLDGGDLQSFQEEARRVLASQPDWRNVLLLDTSGQQLVNLRFPYGTRLPSQSQLDKRGFREVIATRRAFIGDLNPGPGSGLPGIAVRVPVLRGADLRYVLEFILEPAALIRLMKSQGYTTSWTTALVDRQGHFIARVPSPPRELASPDLLASIQRTNDGWYRGKTLEGRDTYTAHKTSAVTGWTAALAIRSDEFNTAAYRASAYMVLGTLISLLSAFAFAYWLSHYIASPIGMLAAIARRIGRESHPAPLTTVKNDPHVQEVFELACALEESAVSLQERELLRQREQQALLAADKAKDEFLAMLGHELRNPLSSIVASAHVLRLSKPGAAAALQAHDVIDRQAQQMARLVEDLLDVSRLAMGKVTLHRERLDLALLAERVLQSWRQARRSRMTRIQANLASVWVYADRVRMEQILLNLLDNAEKFSAPEQHIFVQVHGEEGRAILRVRDEGQGIAPEEMPHIFKLFVQGPQSIERPRGGIGLGLTLVERLTELHGGEVAVFSAGRGQGAAFTVRLPAVAAAEQLPVTDSPSLRPQARRILLVEDNEDGRRMMETMLTLEGHIVRTASTGEAAVQTAIEWRPDIALVDIGLPDFDGHEVARRIRAVPLEKPPKLVALSGFGQPSDLHSAYEAGFDLHLTKPVSPQFLHDVMSALTSKGQVKS